MARSFTKREILKYIVDNTELTLVINYILEKCSTCEKNIASNVMSRLRKALFTLRTKYNSKFKAACSKRDYFKSRNSSWLDSEFKIPDEINVSSKQSSTAAAPGRPSIPFDKKCERAKRREVALISARACNMIHKNC